MSRHENRMAAFAPLSSVATESDSKSSEVYRARSRKTNELYALKKIIMHNEKDGVRSL